MNDDNFETEKTITELIEIVDKTFNIIELIEFEDRILQLIKKKVNIDNEVKSRK